MRRLVALMSTVLAGTSTYIEARAAEVALSVRPVLCITDRRNQSCELAFEIVWRSDTAGAYCLYSDLSRGPIDCWEQASSGAVEESRTVETTFTYWLTGVDSEVRLAEAVVEVMTTESDDRRRNRKRRHAWSIL